MMILLLISIIILLFSDFFFFFQAEDGIRDYKVTGVQTCALPILGALVVGQALIAAGSDAQKEQLAAIIGGTSIAALAHDEPGSHYELNNVATTAVRSGDGWVLNGAKGVVAFGEKADLLLVSARTDRKSVV